MILRFAWRNLRRQTWRSALAVGALTLSVALLVAALALIEGIFAELVRGVTRQYAGDATAVAAGDDARAGRIIERAGMVRDALRNAPGVTGASARLRLPVLLSHQGRRAAGELLGVVPADEAEVTDRRGLLVGGASLDAGDGRGVLLGALLANRLGARPGDEIVITTQAADALPAAGTLLVAGIVATGDPRRDGALAVAGIDTLRSLAGLPGAAHEIGLSFSDPERAPELAAAASRVLPPAAGIVVIPWQRRRPALAEAVRFSRVTSWWLVALFHAAAGMVVLNVLLVNARERRREHALCLALGMPPGSLRAVILAEALLLGLVGVAAGGLLGTVAALATSSRGIDLSRLVGPIGYAGGTLLPVLRAAPRAADLVRACAAMLAVCALAGWIPGLPLARLAPARVLADREAR